MYFNWCYLNTVGAIIGAWRLKATQRSSTISLMHIRWFERKLTVFGDGARSTLSQENGLRLANDRNAVGARWGLSPGQCVATSARTALSCSGSLGWLLVMPNKLNWNLPFINTVIYSVIMVLVIGLENRFLFFFFLSALFSL